MSDNNIPGKNEILFIQLLKNFEIVAWQSLGKIKNPSTDKIERNLDQARYAIDMLEMLREKTENNVSEDEKRFMDSLVRDLQLNYVDESAKPEPEAEEKSEEKTEEPPKEGSPEKKAATKKETPRKKTTKKKTAQKKSGK